jgi:hypothetical protein
MKKPTFIERLKASIFGRRATPTTAKKPTAQTPAKQAAPAKHEPYVFITKSGKKFHWDTDCPSLTEAWARGKVIKMDLSKAKAAGRTACNKCCFDYLHD